MAYLEYIPVVPLFHYTSEAGLRGILHSKELWLSDLRASNDPREIQLGLSTLRSVAEEIGRREYSSENSAILLELVSKVTRYYNISRCYTACFTPHKDNLNMWREYADAGRGYAVGFRPRALTDMLGRIYKARYLDDGNRDEVYNLISEIVKPVEIFGKSLFSEVDREVEIVSGLISVVNSLKHVSWEYEGEVRLTYASGDTEPAKRTPVSMGPDGKIRHWKKHKTRVSDGTEIRYHSMPFGKFYNSQNDSREAILEVIAGPNASMTEGDIKMALRDAGFSNFTASTSACAFR